MAKIKRAFLKLKKTALRYPIQTLILVSIFSSFLFYLPFICHLSSFWGLKYGSLFNFATILKNYDGPNYMIIAKTWYHPEKIKNNFAVNLPAAYFPAHFPSYPALIWLTAKVTGIDIPRAAIIVNLLTSATAIIAFYQLSLLIIKNKKRAFLLSLLFTVFPARWLVVRNVSSPEPLFITLILAAIYFFKKEKYGKAAIFTILSETVKSPGVLLAGALGLSALLKIKEEKNIKKWLKKFWPVLFTPLGLIAVFTLYSLLLGDFFAYFKTGNNIHLTLPPFQAFNANEEWVKTIWLEDVYLIYLGGLILLFNLYQKYRQDVLFIFPAVFYLSLCFVAHRDISRYLLPAVPFLLLGGEEFFTHKKFLLSFLILLPALYLYAINFASFNTALLVDWTPYL